MTPRKGPSAPAPDARALALAEALDGFSVAFAQLAEAVRMPGAAAGVVAAAPAPDEPPAPGRKRMGRPPARGVPSVPVGLSDRQLAAWSRPELDTEAGLSSGQLAKLVGWKQPNADQVLKRLEELGHVSRVPGERPARWVRQSA